MASGIDAAEVLPVVGDVAGDRDASGSASCLAMASMIRMLAWCGMNASRWSTPSPAASSAFWATGDISPDRPPEDGTGLPSAARATRRARASRYSIHEDLLTIASHWAPSEPQTVGPIAGVSLGPTTTAPAPSAKMNAVERSCGSVKSESFSTPTTSTCRAEPPRDHVVAMREAVAEPGAGGRDVERGCRAGADAVRREALPPDGVW